MKTRVQRNKAHRGEQVAKRSVASMSGELERTSSTAEAYRDDHTTKILLIEDDPGHSQLIQRAIKKAGSNFHVTCVTSIADAIIHLRSEKFSSVLTGLSLSNGNSLDSVHRLRQHSASVPVIILTALDDSCAERAALDSGAHDCLPKNEAAPEVLRWAIQYGIQREQLEQQRKLVVKQKRRLKRLYETAQRFVDNVSHEFRTPLAVVKDYVLFVREGICGEVNAEQAQMLDVAVVRANDLNTMVDDLADASRLETSKLGAWRRICRLPEIVAAVAPALRQKAAVREITFTIDLPDKLPQIYCDAEKAGRVIVNLVANAIKSCGERGNVRVSARADEGAGEVVVAVTDNGPGIPSDDLQRMIQRFEQLKFSVRRTTKGFGLGLNIARELTAINLGRMRVKSEAGRGSSFTFSVPVADPREVTKRYLCRIRTIKKTLPLVSVVTVQLQSPTSITASDDVDLFLAGLLGQNDLMWRLDTDSWLMMIAMCEDDVERFLKKLEDEHTCIDCLRSGGPVPRLDANVEGTWHVVDQSAEILERLDQLFLRCEGVACGASM